MRLAVGCDVLWLWLVADAVVLKPICESVSHEKVTFP